MKGNTNMNLLCLDTETTGFSPQHGDDIIQLSMINGHGDVFNCYYAPRTKTSWDEASAINGIYPEDVEGYLPFAHPQSIAEVQSIIDKTDLIIGYNVNFDLNFMREAGIVLSGVGEINDSLFDFRDWCKAHPELPVPSRHNLTAAAEYFGYSFNAHNALEDVKATLFVWNALKQNNVVPHAYRESELAERASKHHRR